MIIRGRALVCNLPGCREIVVFDSAADAIGQKFFGKRPDEVVFMCDQKISVSYTHLTLPTICSV